MTEQAKPKPNKIIAGLMRIIEEFERKLSDIDYQIREANLAGVLSSVNEFREIMNDLHGLVSKDMNYFNIRVSVWKSGEGLKAGCCCAGPCIGVQG